MATDTYYLIDFENVGLKGLDGAEKLTLQDHVHLFSTRNAPKINTATLAHFNGTSLIVHEVPAKNQSVDMHLVSYLGYLLGSGKPFPDIVIISNDTDYDDIVQYWKTELNVDIRRRDRFEAPKAVPVKAVRPAPQEKPTAAVKVKAEKADAKKAETAGTDKADKPKDTKADKPKPEKDGETKDKTAVNNAVMKTLSTARFDNEIVGYAASLVTRSFQEKNGKQLIYRSIISKYGQERGLEIYRCIKKIL